MSAPKDRPDSLDFDPFLYGPLLAGVNNEVRALFMASVLLNGPMSVSDTHHYLKDRGYDEHHEMQPTHLRTLAKRSPAELLDQEKLGEQDFIELTPAGERSAILGGVLLSEVGGAFDVDLHQVVGGHKQMKSAKDKPLAPAVRLSVYETLLQTATFTPPKVLLDRISATGVTQKSIRKHLESLEKNGHIKTKPGARGERSLEEDSVELIDRYDEVVRGFIDEGLLEDAARGYLERLLQQEGSWESSTLPYLTKRSVLGSGRSNPIVTKGVNERIREYFQESPEFHTATTTEIAQHLQIPTYLVTSYLNRIIRCLGGEASISLVGKTAHTEGERIWKQRKLDFSKS